MEKLEEDDIESLKVALLFFISSNISRYFFDKIEYINVIFMSILPFISLIIYLLVKIVQNFIIKKSIRTHIVFLVISIFRLYSLYRDLIDYMSR